MKTGCARAERACTRPPQAWQGGVRAGSRLTSRPGRLGRPRFDVRRWCRFGAGMRGAKRDAMNAWRPSTTATGGARTLDRGVCWHSLERGVADARTPGSLAPRNSVGLLLGKGRAAGAKPVCVLRKGYESLLRQVLQCGRPPGFTQTRYPPRPGEPCNQQILKCRYALASHAEKAGSSVRNENLSVENYSRIEEKISRSGLRLDRLAPCFPFGAIFPLRNENLFRSQSPRPRSHRCPPPKPEGPRPQTALTMALEAEASKSITHQHHARSTAGFAGGGQVIGGRLHQGSAHAVAMPPRMRRWTFAGARPHAAVVSAGLAGLRWSGPNARPSVLPSRVSSACADR